MKSKRVVFASIVAVILFLAAVAAGINAVFSVGSVRLELSAFSQIAHGEGQQLQDELNGFIGSSMLFLDAEELEEKIEKYPRFRLTEIKKDYPQTVVVKVSEREETFAVKGDGGYTMLDSEGIVLFVSDQNKNSADGAANVLLSGVAVTEKAGETVGEDVLRLIGFAKSFLSPLSDLRMNLAEVRLDTSSPDSVSEYYSLHLSMNEGVEVVVYDPLNDTDEKLKAAADRYRSLDDGERLYGRIIALKNASGMVEATYSSRSSDDESVNHGT